MMTNPWVELLIVLSLIAANGAFALAELAIISSRKTRLQQRARAGSKSASTALQLAADPNRMLSSVQIGITLVGTIAGVFGGASISRHLTEQLVRFPLLAPYAEPIGLALVVFGLTYLMLVLGELVPKRLAMSNPEAMALWVSPTLKWLSIATKPMVKVLSFSTDIILWLLRVRGPATPSVTEEDIKLLVTEGLNAGVLEPSEQDIILRVFRLTDRRAGSLMTPRNQIVWIDVADSPEEMLAKIRSSPHSNFPVCDGSLDNLLGVVRVKDLLLNGLAERPLALKGRLSLPLFVFEGTRGHQILETLRRSGQHFAVVLDEFGSVVGVLTMTDLFEALVGAMPKSDEPSEPPAVKREDGSWLLDGKLAPEEIGDLIQHAPLPTGDYRTLAGVLIARLGRIPEVGEVLVWEDLRFEVMDMDGNRVDRILVSFTGAKPDEQNT